MDTGDLVIGLASGSLLTLAGLVGLCLTQRHRDTLPFQMVLFLTAMAVRFVAAVVLHETSLYEAVVGSADASGWEGGHGLKQTLDGSLLGPLAIPQELWTACQGVNQGYGTLVGLYFYVTRLDSELSAAALSCVCGALTAVATYRLARLIFSEAVAARSGWWICFFPSMIIWSIQTIKEPIIILCETLLIYVSTCMVMKKTSLRHVALGVACIFLLLPLRFYAAYSLSGVVVASLVVPDLGGGRLPIGSAVVLAVILAAALSGMSAMTRTHQEVVESYDLDRIQGFRTAVAMGAGSGSGVDSSYDVRTGHGLVLGTLVGALHLLLAPFPWQFAGGSKRLLLTAPEMVVWWVLVGGGLWRGLGVCLKRHLGAVLPMLLFMLMLGLVYSMMFGNIGIIYRQRTQLLPYLMMIIFVGLEAKRARRLSLPVASAAFLGRGEADSPSISAPSRLGTIR